ncbi:hypothetical protein PspLS_00446 [Pyricularia sp. CBS 133598]|nr:hypothetical protein PspLS_00446 [Pyricularia sp. CBS 133598]
MYSIPPVPPPKSGSSHEASRIGTPSAGLSQTQSPRPAPVPNSAADSTLPEAASSLQVARPEPIEDPGDQWLPKILEDKSKQDLADILSSPSLLSALTHSPWTAHPSLSASHATLQSTLADNVSLAQHLSSTEAHLSAQRSSAQAQLLSTHALERQWHAKQREADAALAPFAPDGLYLRLAQAVQEQGAVCDALEESFLEGGGGGGRGGGGGGGGGAEVGDFVTEREALDWVRRYREARKRLYLRQEKKERWDEGRVGGWR